MLNIPTSQSVPLQSLQQLPFVRFPSSSAYASAFSDCQEIELFKEDLLIDTAQIEGYESVNDNGITVVLDTNLTPELLEEGFVREIISKIQTMRKEADFEVMDKIRVTYEGSEKAEAVFEKNSTLIGGEVLATEVVKAEPAGHVKEWKINGEAVTMGVEKKGE